MKLHLLRHPRPAVEHGLCYGASDVPADAAALDQVLAALREAGLPGDLPVYTSPLRRCRDLASALTPAALYVDARLAEMDFGAWEMRPWSAIPRADVDAWNADLLHYRPGGAENVMDVARRVAAFRAGLLAAGAAEALVICHAGTIRLLLAMRPGLSLEQAALEAASTPHRIGYGQLQVLDIA
ncbi:histidine phosphatase family protein [Massilia sp. TN1-12]|uniref:histidine phosphatase family protein n=1 Tax=Massilia paldalensis TaxID=3377675 RepID=UPI00384C7657